MGSIPVLYSIPLTFALAVDSYATRLDYPKTPLGGLRLERGDNLPDQAAHALQGGTRMPQDDQTCILSRRAVNDLSEAKIGRDDYSAFIPAYPGLLKVGGAP